MLLKSLLQVLFLLKSIISIQFDMNLRQTASSMETELNVKKNLFFVNINVGTPAQSFEVLYDVGSFHLWLGNSTLVTRLPKIFNIDQSSTYHQTENEIMTSNQKGTEVDDVVYINNHSPDNTKKKLNYVMLNQLQTGVSYDGVLGLARNYPGKIKYSSKRWVDSNPRFSFINYLYTTGQITKTVFAHKFTSKTKATLYIGESGSMKSGIPLCTPDATLNASRLYHLWNCGSHGFSTMDGTVIDNQSNSVIFDSARETIVLPPAVGEKLFTFYNEKTGGSYCTVKTLKRGASLECNSNFPLGKVPDIKININGFDGIFKGKDMFELTYNENDNEKNYVYLSKFYSPEKMNHIILGTAFMKYYHMIFDMESGTIGFAGYNDIFMDAEEMKKLKINNNWSFLQILLVLGIGFAVFGGIFIILKKRAGVKKKLKEFTHEREIKPIGQPMLSPNERALS